MCKLGGAIPLVPSVCTALNKSYLLCNLTRVIEFDSASRLLSPFIFVAHPSRYRCIACHQTWAGASSSRDTGWDTSAEKVIPTKGTSVPLTTHLRSYTYAHFYAASYWWSRASHIESQKWHQRLKHFGWCSGCRPLCAPDRWGQAPLCARCARADPFGLNIVQTR